MRKRVHDLESSAGASESTTHNSATDVLYDASLLCAKRAERHEERGHREVAVGLYQQTRSMLTIVRLFATKEEAPRVDTATDTVNRRLHVLTTDSFSQIGHKTLEAESQLIDQTADDRPHPRCQPPSIYPMPQVIGARRRMEVSRTAMDAPGTVLRAA